MKTPVKHFTIIASLAIASVLGCSAQAQSTSTTTTTTESTTSSTSENKGDGNKDAITPFSQSNAQEDLNVTQNIRKAIVSEKGMSVDAQNIKIITTVNHEVYLKGVVDTEAERARILALAKPIAGDRMIKNHLKLPAETHKS